MNIYLNLKKNFKEYLVGKEPLFGGARYRFRFENNYGASVIKNFGSYGSEEDLWELALIRWSDHDWDIVYDNPVVSGGILGYLSDEDVLEVLEEIKEL